MRPRITLATSLLAGLLGCSRSTPAPSPPAAAGDPAATGQPAGPGTTTRVEDEPPPAEDRAGASRRPEMDHGEPPRDPPPPGVEVRTEGLHEVWIRREDRGRATHTCWSSSRDDHASGFCGARPSWTLRFHAISIQGSDQPRLLRVALRHALEPGFRACQEAAPEVTGAAALKATIRADGALVDTAATGLGDAEVEACLAKAMAAARVERALPRTTASATWRITLARGAAPP